MSKDPRRLSLLKPLRAEIDAELAQATTMEDAVSRGYVESSGNFAVRIWQNCIDAIAARTQADEDAILVWRRDKKDVQVWVRATVKPEEPISKQAVEDAHTVMEEFLKTEP